MDYSLNEAKTIFDLIANISRYAIPLLLSLVFPFLWYFLKIIFGLSEKPVAKTESVADLKPNKSVPLTSWFKWLSSLSSWMKLGGDRLDKFVFYSCILLFLIGIGVLKFGEWKQERTRQQTQSLKKYFESQKLMNVSEEWIYNLKISKKQLSAILYDSPKDFVRIDSTIYFVDSIYLSQYEIFTFPLIAMNLENEFRKDSIIILDSLFNSRNELGNLMNLNLILKYLGTQEDKFLLSQDTINPSRVLLQKR